MKIRIGQNQLTVAPKDVVRLMGKVVAVEGGCWEYSGHCDRKGYGQIWLCGKMHWVHRVAYAVFRGPIEGDLTVHHECANPKCCRPDHLNLLSNHENAAERWRRS